MRNAEVKQFDIGSNSTNSSFSIEYAMYSRLNSTTPYRDVGDFLDLSENTTETQSPQFNGLHNTENTHDLEKSECLSRPYKKPKFNPSLKCDSNLMNESDSVYIPNFPNSEKKRTNSEKKITNSEKKRTKKHRNFKSHIVTVLVNMTTSKNRSQAFLHKILKNTS